MPIVVRLTQYRWAVYLEGLEEWLTLDSVHDSFRAALARAHTIARCQGIGEGVS